MTELEKYSDKAMYAAAPMDSVEPKVHLLWMTPDPLGAVAAMGRMYEGIPTYSLADITDDERRKYWKAMGETHLQAPLEAVKLHFFIEGVDRSFTHQMVRQRTAVYAQESLRFAVKEDLVNEVPYPPSFDDKRVVDSISKANDVRATWNKAVDEVDRAYRSLIANGVPAEDARGLLPHAVLTRLNYVTDLRNLLEHAGNRMCTQAQFHWRKVFMGIREAIRGYWRTMAQEDWRRGDKPQPWTPSMDSNAFDNYDAWQFQTIADTAFKPQCYLQGKCTFKADFDRGCTIRGRVDHFARRGVPSFEWANPDVDHISSELSPIDEAEWLDDPQAGWVR